MAWFDFLNQANPKGQDAGSIARQRLNARAAIPIKPTVGLRGAGKFISPLFAIPDIIEQTQQVINPQDNIITRLGALGNSIENVIGSGGGAPRATKSPPGQQQRPIGTQAVLNGKPVYWGGDDYGWQLLNGTGSSATLNSLNTPGTQGRSGFAHFFEHMMFQGSKNVADEQHFKIITEAGGTLNGSTNSDRTNYFETVHVPPLVYHRVIKGTGDLTVKIKEII